MPVRFFELPTPWAEILMILFVLDLFNFLRPNDLNLLAAISDSEGEVSFYYQKIKLS